MVKFFPKFWLLGVLALATLELSTFAPKAHGATIALRKQASPAGSVIFLGDIADISAETEAEVQALSTTPLMAAPAAGRQEFLHAAKVWELIESRGVAVTNLTLVGARVVEIGASTVTTIRPSVDAPPTVPLPEVEQAAVSAITAHLVTETGQHDWQVELNMAPQALNNLAKLGLPLEASAGKSPWIGTQRFQLQSRNGGKPVTVIAKVDQLRKVVVATRRIERGNLVSPADVELRLEGGNVPSTAVRSLDSVIGQEALRTIDVNSIVQESQLRSPLQVQRGEIVKVFAQTGGIRVSTYAVVQQNGALGDLVQVQTLDKRERFAARVSGWKQLEVLPTGASTADYATLNHLESRTR